MAKLQVLREPKKSPHDKKEYKTVVLPNGLKVLLISDPSFPTENEFEDDESENDEYSSEDESGSEVDDDGALSADGRDDSSESKKQAAAALCVGVGSFLDPDNIPGLAHFLEHMVFMGTETYPDENHFDKFIQTHGGSDNASTDCEHTMYQFEVNPKYLKQALEIWSKFFICPLMTYSCIGREVKAVDSEFQMAVVDDQPRFEQLLGHLCKHNPINKFLWGNEVSLKQNPEKNGVDVYKTLHEFHKQHYYAPKMVLALQSNESLDTLQQWVVEIFSDVPVMDVRTNGVQTKEVCADVPTSKLPSFTLCNVVPVQNIQEMHFIWFLPSVIKNYKCKPLHYALWLISHEGKGGLLSCLKEKHLATSIATNDDDRSGFDDCKLYALVSIDITLTDLGVKNKNEVIDIVFAYISMIRESGPSTAIYKEIQQIELNNFTYMDEDTPLNNVECGAQNLLLYAPEDVWTGDYLMSEYNPNLIQEVMNGLMPDKCMLFLYDSNNKNLNPTELKKEPWFGTQFFTEKIDQTYVDKWLANDFNYNLSLPLENHFIPSDFTLVDSQKSSEDLITNPSLLVDEPLLKTWFKTDHKFNLPKGFARFILNNSNFTATTEHQVFLDLLVEVLEYNLSEVMFDATAASFYYGISISNYYGLQVKVSGCSHKMNLVVDLLFDHLFGFSTNQEVFEEQRMLLKKSYYNKLLESKKLCKDIRLTLLERQRFSIVDKYAIMDQLTLPAFLAFVKAYLAGLRVESLVQGNFDAKGGMKLVSKIQEKLKASAPCRVVENNRILTVPITKPYIHIRAMNLNDDNSMVTIYLQVGACSVCKSVELELLNMIMGEPCFDILRTKKQLGYSVYTIDHHTAGVLGLSLNVQSQNSKFSVEQLTETMVDFLHNVFYSLLKKMSPEEFQEHVDALDALKKVDDTQLEEEVNRNWDEILSRDFVFDRLKREIKELETVTHRDVLSLYESIVLSQPRQLTIQVRGNTPDQSGESTDQIENLTKFVFLEANNTQSPSNANGITNFASFRKTAQYYPVCHTQI
uniref:Insulin-degrading enzyme n=1 Tax=Phallusia mammillata TaxID=59560 RepID=A0A6F9DF74_9ASCI|nr:insulin-degrading enzyme [Phallusia mammillata]